MTQNRESFEYGVHILVVNVHQESSLAVGKHFEVRNLPVTLGRSLEAGVRLSDNTVSREHARLDWRDGKLLVEALSVRAKVWLNKVQVHGGESVELTDGDSLLQLGGVLLRVSASPPTEPFQRPLAPPTPKDVLLHVECTDDAVLIRLGGKEVQLHRGPAFVFAALAVRPNEPVHESEMLLTGGGNHDRALERNLNQMITYARNAIAHVLQGDEELLKATLRAVVAASKARGDERMNDCDAETLCARQLARELIKNQRGFGYSLRLLPASLHLVDHRTPTR